MNTQKGRIKTEFLILGLVIVALTMILFLGNQNRVSYDIPTISPLEKASVDRVELGIKGETLVLERSGNRWHLKKTGYPVDNDKITQMLTALENLKITTLVSQSGDYRRYGLDKDGSISVHAFAKKREVRSFLIGKVASTYRHTFVRFPDKKGVYHADGSIRSHFAYSAAEWRDKNVMKFDPEEITSLSVSMKEKKATFTRATTAPPPENIQKNGSDHGEPATGQISWKSSLSGPVATTTVDSLLKTLSDLPCQDFTPGKPVSTIEGNAIAITLQGEKQYTLALDRRKEGEADIFPAHSSLSPETFVLAPYKAEELLRQAEALFTSGEKPVSKNDPSPVKSP